MEIETHVQVPMRDGTHLSANIYRPDDEEPAPVILNVGPYGKDVLFRDVYRPTWVDMVRRNPEIVEGSGAEHIVWETPDPERWTSYGYTLVHADSRGTGRSAGFYDPFSPEYQRDFFDAVEWAGTQPWSNGKVGVLGVSYYAMVAWQAAALRPPHLAAIIPWNGVADLYRDWAYHGGVLSTFGEYWWNRWLLNQHGHPHGRPATHGGERTTGPETLDEQSRAVVPDEVYEVEVEIWPTSFRLPAGGRIALTLQGEDDPDVHLAAHNHPQDRPASWTRATHTLHTGPERPSRMLLPVIETGS